MELSSPSTFYEVLDIQVDATPQEIRSAYLRAKASFQKESLALYSLLDANEAEVMIQRIEEAYQTLSHPERKKAYDRTHIEAFQASVDPVFARNTDFIEKTEELSSSHKIFSIDRVPPMDSLVNEDILTPPSTDSLPSQQLVETPKRGEVNYPIVTEWSGPEIRKRREQLEVALEALVESTKIRKSYLIALENEEFAKLPARVFVRGFLQQISRELKISSDALIDSYLNRLQQWSISQNNKSG